MSLLGRFAERIGGSSAQIEPLRALQEFRSKGGIAHLAGSGREKAMARLGIDGMTTWQAFDAVAAEVTGCLNDIADLMQSIEFSGPTSDPAG